MHELSLVYDVVHRVKEVCASNNVTEVESLTLQIGELSSVIPHYVEACYPAATEGTILEGTKLIIEVLPGNAVCLDCDSVYRVLESDGKCPKCGSDRSELLCGKEFFIKELLAK